MSADTMPRCALEVSPVTLSAWRDGALAPAETRRIEAHIPDCPACRDRLAEYDMIAGKLAAIRIPEPVGGHGHSPRTSLAAHRAYYGRHSLRFAGDLRTLAAVLVVALLGAGFFALLHGIPRPAGHPTPTATRIAATATPAPSPTVSATTTAEVTMPNVVGQSLAVAVVTIQQANLQAAAVPQVDPQVTLGDVIRTTPAGGTRVAQNSTVTIYYAAPQPTTATPTVTGAGPTPTDTP